MMSGWQLAPYSRRYGLELVSKPRFRSRKVGGATIERLFWVMYWTRVTIERHPFVAETTHVRRLRPPQKTKFEKTTTATE